MMRAWKRMCTLVAVAAGVALVAPQVSAGPKQHSGERRKKTSRPKRYSVKTSRSSIEAGAARIHVAAPAEIVRKVVTDYRRYEKFMPRFKKSRIVGRKHGKTDVYLQVPILNGAAKIWAIVRFDAPRMAGGEEVITGRMIKGNVKRLDAVWRIAKIDDEHTRLNLEMLIVPRLPVPGKLVTDEVAFAADKAVSGSRDRAELVARRN